MSEVIQILQAPNDIAGGYRFVRNMLHCSLWLNLPIFQGVAVPIVWMSIWSFAAGCSSVPWAFAVVRGKSRRSQQHGDYSPQRLRSHQAAALVVIRELMLHDVLPQPLAHHSVLKKNPEVIVQ